MKDNKSVWVGIVIVIVAAVGAALLLNNGGDKTTSDSSSSSSSSSSQTSKAKTDDQALSNAVATNSVDIKDFAFSPAVIKVKVGEKVTWTNQDSVKHNVESNNKSSDGIDGPLLAKGESYSFTFTKAGTYTLHCDPHPYMHQVVQVTE